MARWKTSRCSRTDLGRLEEHQRVRPQTEPQRLQPEEVGGRDVAEVDVRAEQGDEVRLQILGRRLEQQLIRVDTAGEDRLDEPVPEAAVGPADAALAALP